MRRTSVVLALVLSAGLSGCVSSPPAPEPQPLSAAAERGRSFALRACGGCHALGSGRQSANAVAPSFATIRMRHTSLALERALADIAREGHGEMPPIYMTAGEIEDLVAYVESLEPMAGRRQDGVLLTSQPTS